MLKQGPNAWNHMLSSTWSVLVLQDYINKLTHLLLAAEGDAGGPAVEQIRELVESQRWAVQCYGKSDMSKLMKISLDVRREGSPRFTSVDAAHKLMVRHPHSPGHLVPALTAMCALTVCHLRLARIALQRRPSWVLAISRTCSSCVLLHCCFICFREQSCQGAALLWGDCILTPFAPSIATG